MTGISSISSAYNGCMQESLSITVGSTTNQITTSGFSYDASGDVGTDATNTYTHDAEGRMITASIPSSGLYCYAHDGDGRRVQKSQAQSGYTCSSGSPNAPTVTMLYWYGTGNALTETDGSGNLIDEYVFFNGKRIARRDASGNVDYYFGDQLGSARVVTNASGTILDDSDFYPYGGERPVTGPSSGNTYKFTGKERDSESGLDNFGARYDSSQYGRFMTPDPLGGSLIDPQTLNKYSYVRNNPVTLTDPTGLYTIDCTNDVNKCQQHGRPHDLSRDLRVQD